MSAWLERVELTPHRSLDHYASFVSLSSQVEALRSEARLLVPQLARATVWMVSSTAVGGGVAEMMPQVVSLLEELGLRVAWLVLRTDEPRFFALTKRLHNLLHGHGDPALGPADRALYDGLSRQWAAALASQVAPGDVVVVHDPQPLAVGALVRAAREVRAIWRCHIGVEEDTPATRAGWDFLRPWASAYDHAIFSAHGYIRDFLAGRSSVMHPTIDPLSHKNRELSPLKLTGILCNAGLLTATQPILTPPFDHPAMRLGPDGRFHPATVGGDIGMPFRPIVTQISRWDRLKGFAPLLEAFCALKRRPRGTDGMRRGRRLQIVRLVLAGPEPHSIQDDPEARDVLDELSRRWLALPRALQADVALLALPMSSRKHNHLMINCLQRCSSVVVQNSIAEGFGLTAAEALWKGVCVAGSQACGLRQQIRDRLDGRLWPDATDAEAIAEVLDEVLADAKQRLAWGRSGQRRVYEELLVFTQVREWLRLFAELARRELGRPVALEDGAGVAAS